MSFGPIFTSWLSALSHVFLIYIASIALVYFFLSTLRSWYPLRSFKGPFLGSISNVWHFNAVRSGEMYLKYYEAVQQYGDLVRISPDELLTVDPELVRRMNSPRSPYKRSAIYEISRPDSSIHAIFTETDVKKHDALRAKMASAYSGKENPDLETRIDSRIRDLFNLIERKYLSTDSKLMPMNLGKVASYLTLDIITDLAYGAPFGFLEKDEDLHGYLQGMELGIKVALSIGTIPWLAKLLQTRLAVSLMGSSPPGISTVMRLAREVVDARFGSKKLEQQDMLGAFLRNGLSRDQATVEVWSQLLAGSDTTATAIRTTILYIVSNPLIHAKLLAEIDDAVQSNVPSPITDADARGLPYLQACIKENIRLWPPFVGGNPKEVPKGGDTINGKFVPGGINIHTCIWGMQRNDIFGAHPEVYRPERWLEVDQEQARQMQGVMDLVFGYGRTSCMGKTIAMIELNKVFFEIFRQFDIVLLNPVRPIESQNFNIFMQKEMPVRVSVRKAAVV